MHDASGSKQEKERPLLRTVGHYAISQSFHCEVHRVTTADGFILIMHRIVPGRSTDTTPTPRHPVLLQHGLFMSSGVFVTNDSSSLAFFLAEKGYDVWLGNNRGAACLEHTKFTTNDPEFWDWCVDDLARYDVPAMVDHVLKSAGQPSLTWVGHSQGNAQAFMALSSIPSLTSKIRLMVAVAPTARLGELPSAALRFLRREHYFETLFGTTQFVPMISYVLDLAPASLFALLGYNMFYYLFRWSDTRWLKSRKAKYFQFTGLPVSCKQIRHWIKMTMRGGLSRYDTGELYPIENIRVPLAVFHGEKDEIADADALQKLLLSNPTVPLRRFERIADYEHLDLIWATDAVEKSLDKIHEVISQELAREQPDPTF